MITQERLKELYYYKDGNLLRRCRTSNSTKPDEVIGWITSSGYRQASVDNRKYMVHRLIFLYRYGYLPDIIDHIDGDKLNNSIENLRECTKETNGYNSTVKSNNTTGVKNVSYDKRKRKYRVTTTVNRKVRFFGYYDDIELAELVAEEVRNKYHKEFARHG